MLLTEEYTRAKLADFDSAKRLSDEFTEAGLQPLGTKGFASPEVSMLILSIFIFLLLYFSVLLALVFMS